MTSKEEYLKRYLSTGTEALKKKKKRTGENARIRILDDDIDVKALIPGNIKNTLDEDIGDDKPAVAQFIDERPKEVKELEHFRQSKRWKVIAPDNEPDGLTTTSDKQWSSQDQARQVDLKARRRHDSDGSDLSPTRPHMRGHHQGTNNYRSPLLHNGNTSLSNRKQRNSESDLSPKKRTQHDYTASRPDNSKMAAAGRQRHDSDSDLSPERHSNNNRSRTTDERDSAKQRHDSDSDLSPERQSGRGSEKNASNTSNNRHVSRHDSDSDLSPERKYSKNSSARLSEKNTSEKGNIQRDSARNRNDSDSDLSPERKSGGSLKRTNRQNSARNRHDSDSDGSPNKNLDRNSPHKRTLQQGRNDSDSDLSPVRFSDKHSSEKSSTKVSKHRRKHQPEEKRRRSCSDSDLSPERPNAIEASITKAAKTLSGAKAGLLMASDMRHEAKELKKKENDAFAQISDEYSGRNAATVLRDKSTGRRRNLAEEQAKQAEEDAVKAALAAKYEQWNKGVKQKELREEKIASVVHEANKPLARYADDEDLDARLRQQEHEEDPMLAYMRKKKAKKEQRVQQPMYRGPEPPPNRFGIRPGYRWDGVDRSNGFENLYFSKLSEKKALKEMAYKWSVEDM